MKDPGTKGFFTVWFIGAVLTLAVWVALIVVVIHFARKWW